MTTVYLSCFDNPNKSSLHRVVMAGFAGDLGPDPRAAVNALFRVDGPHILVQSTAKPRWPSSYQAQTRLIFTHQLMLNKGTAAIGDRYRFRLGFQSIGQDTRSGHTVRFPVPPAQWLADRQERLGAQLEIGEVWCQRHVDYVRKSYHSKRFAIDVTHVEGYLTVTDPARLATVMVQGIGRGKAYGCGLLSLVPVRVAVTVPALVGVAQG